MVPRPLFKGFGSARRVRVPRRLVFPGDPQRIPLPILDAFNQQVQDMAPGAPRRPRMVRSRFGINPLVRVNLFP